MKKTLLSKHCFTIWIIVGSSVAPNRTNLASGQTLINLGAQSRNVDFSNAAETRPTQVGTPLPATCSTGSLFFLTSATAGQNLYGCSTPNVWSAIGQSTTNLMDPGTNGVLKRTASNTTTTVAAPNGALVGTTDVQTLTNKSIDSSEINSGTLSAARLPGFIGDINVPVGSNSASLSVVNSAPGTYGDSTHSLQVTVDAKGRVTSVGQVQTANSLATQFYQQVKSVGTNLTQRSAVNFSSAFAISDNNAGVRTDVDLTAVNGNPGTFGSTTQIPVITVNNYGQVTAVSTVSASGNTSSNNSSTTNTGTLSAISSSCSVGSMYVATDQPVGQQLYICSSTNSWTQSLSMGGSGALAMNNGSLDIVTNVVPRLAAANSFTGLNVFTNGLVIAPSIPQPTCNTSMRGMFWFLNNGTSKDSVQVCVYNGSVFNWTSLY